VLGSRWIPLSHLLGLTWAVACANDWRPGNRARGWGRIGEFAGPRLTTACMRLLLLTILWLSTKNDETFLKKCDHLQQSQ
jgi:hypothetical protein